MTLAKLMVYEQSNEESKIRMMSWNLKRSVASGQVQPRVKNRVLTQDRPSVSQKTFVKGGCSQNDKPTFSTCYKKRYGGVYWVPLVALDV